MSELCTDNTTVTVGAGDLAPNDPALVALFVSLLGLVDVGHTLAEIEGSILLGLDALNSEEGGAHVLVSLASLVAKEDGAGVKSGCHLCASCEQ